MITVEIRINERTVIARSAVNVGASNTDPTGDVHVYEVDDGRRLLHRRSEGALKLAQAMLAGVREPGWKGR